MRRTLGEIGTEETRDLLMSVSDVRKASYFSASYSTSFLFLFKPRKSGRLGPKHRKGWVE